MADTENYLQIPQGYFSKNSNAFVMTAFVPNRDATVLAGSNDVWCTFVLPCAGRIIKIDYIIGEVATANVTDIYATADGGSAMTTPTTGVQADIGLQIKNTLVPTTVGQEYAAGTRIDITGNGVGSIRDAAVSMIVQPVGAG